VEKIFGRKSWTAAAFITIFIDIFSSTLREGGKKGTPPPPIAVNRPKTPSSVEDSAEIRLRMMIPEWVTPLPCSGKVGGFIANKKIREGGFTANPPSQN